MTANEYLLMEEYMKELMQDSAHDIHHVYRVLYLALEIAEYETEADLDVLTAASLLHDIGRQKQFENPALCHAQVGSEMAYEFLLGLNWSQDKASHVKECIFAHRYRGDNRPQSIEAKILFDADKLDVTGAMGIARTLTYKGAIDEPIYVLDENDGIVTEGAREGKSSFFQEYNYKLRHIYESFYTVRGKKIALERQKAAVDFYNSLHDEISSSCQNGRRKLDKIIL